MNGQQPDGTFAVEAAQPRPKRHMSISQLDTMSKCGEQYRRKYILGQKLPFTISIMVGITVDRFVTVNLDRKMIKGEFMDRDEIREFVVGTYRREILEAGDIAYSQEELLNGEIASKQEGEDKALRLALLHASEAAPKLKPIYLQRGLRVSLPGYPVDLAGVIDIQEFDSVRDTKTKSKTPPKGFIDADDQLTVYALLVLMNDGMIPPRLVLDCLVDTKVPKYVPLETTRTEDDFDPLLARIGAACTALERGVFIPARESDWWCSKNYCGFWADCKYVKRSQRPAA